MSDKLTPRSEDFNTWYNAHEERVQDETKATLRCLPWGQSGSGICFYTGKSADRVAIFG